MNQTLSLTTLGALEPGDRVNLEPALRAGDRSAATSSRATSTASARSSASARTGSRGGSRRRARTSSSATWSSTARSRSTASASRSPASTTTGFEVSLIPETLERTTLGEAADGRRVNVEIDVIARYVERLLGFNKEKLMKSMSMT